jgi:hypothetical protein
MRDRLLLLTNICNSDPEEDLLLARALHKRFEVAIVHPMDCAALEEPMGHILIRNTWPLNSYRTAYARMQARWMQRGIKTYNALDGRADLRGKSYLIEMYRRGFPAVPTVSRVADIGRLGDNLRYIVKPVFGCSSRGVYEVSSEQLNTLRLRRQILQPLIDIVYEISWYFVDGDLAYALYAPDRAKRWELLPYCSSDSDRAFAEASVTWNTLSYGIQRIDAARTRDGRLLLMEIEDHNPYLSLHCLTVRQRNAFFERITNSLLRHIYV